MAQGEKDNGVSMIDEFNDLIEAIRVSWREFAVKLVDLSQEVLIKAEPAFDELAKAVMNEPEEDFPPELRQSAKEWLELRGKPNEPTE
jgi:hypothetical protein